MSQLVIFYYIFNRFFKSEINFFPNFYPNRTKDRSKPRFKSFNNYFLRIYKISLLSLLNNKFYEF